MVMPAAAYLEAQCRARYHVQVELERPPAIGQTPAHVLVSGWVGRVFRGDGALQPGDWVHFRVAVCRSGDPVPCGGELWMDVQDLAPARYLEVFLDGVPPECRVAGSRCQVIEKFTHAPRIAAPAAEEVAAAWKRFDLLASGPLLGRLLWWIRRRKLR